MRWQTMLRATGCVLLAVVVAGCATPGGDARSHQRAMLKSSLTAAIERDDLYEGSMGVRRTDANFPAVKSALGNVYRDPVILDWMVNQLQNDRDRFSQNLARLMSDAFARADDAAAAQMVRPVATLFGRFTPQQCTEFLAAAKDRGNDGTALMMRSMNDGEIREFFDGMRQAMRRGIEGAPLRPVPTSAELLTVMNKLGSSAMAAGAGGPGSSNCQDAVRVLNEMERLTGTERSHALTFMMMQAGLAANRQLQ